jgi:hypothetical protein
MSLQLDISGRTPTHHRPGQFPLDGYVNPRVRTVEYKLPPELHETMRPIDKANLTDCVSEQEGVLQCAWTKAIGLRPSEMARGHFVLSLRREVCTQPNVSSVVPETHGPVGFTINEDGVSREGREDPERQAGLMARSKLGLQTVQPAWCDLSRSPTKSQLVSGTASFLLNEGAQVEAGQSNL